MKSNKSNNSILNSFINKYSDIFKKYIENNKGNLPNNLLEITNFNEDYSLTLHTILYHMDTISMRFNMLIAHDITFNRYKSDGNLNYISEYIRLLYQPEISILDYILNDIEKFKFDKNFKVLDKQIRIYKVIDIDLFIDLLNNNPKYKSIKDKYFNKDVSSILNLITKENIIEPLGDNLYNVFLEVYSKLDTYHISMLEDIVYISSNIKDFKAYLYLSIFKYFVKDKSRETIKVLKRISSYVIENLINKVNNKDNSYIYILLVGYLNDTGIREIRPYLINRFLYYITLQKNSDYSKLLELTTNSLNLTRSDISMISDANRNYISNSVLFDLINYIEGKDNKEY